MNTRAIPPLKRVLELGREYWDHNDMRPDVRDEFRKVLDCRTAALGAEIFRSEDEERIVPHTCKSRACPSCGRRATVQWQREQWRDLPECSYAHVTLTMPHVLWPIFQRNRRLLHDLPALGARIIELWARAHYGVRLMILVMPHTFGRHLNFNCHLHVLVSEGGLKDDDSTWIRDVHLDRDEVMERWRYAVTHHLRTALGAGVLSSHLSDQEIQHLLESQCERWWNIHIKRFTDKKHVLAYAGRYARHPPIAQHRFRKIDRDEVTFITGDTKTKRKVEMRYSLKSFLETLADHIPGRYQHNVRHFGLLGPRSKAQTHDLVFDLLGQKRLGKPKRLPWAFALRKAFGVDPLIDSSGRRMRWVGRNPAVRNE